MGEASLAGRRGYPSRRDAAILPERGGPRITPGRAAGVDHPGLAP
jgi:hypothetical protein